MTQYFHLHMEQNLFKKISGLLHKGKYINYNVLCSPYDFTNGESTKGQKLFL